MRRVLIYPETFGDPGGFCVRSGQVARKNVCQGYLRVYRRGSARSNPVCLRANQMMGRGCVQIRPLQHIGKRTNGVLVNAQRSLSAPGDFAALTGRNIYEAANKINYPRTIPRASVRGGRVDQKKKKEKEGGEERGDSRSEIVRRTIQRAKRNFVSANAQ